MSELMSAPLRVSAMQPDPRHRAKSHRWLAVVIIAILASCKPAGDVDGSPTSEPHYGKRGQTYPPTAVAALSVTSASIQAGKTPYQSAVNCAAAILITKAALTSSAITVGTAANQALDQAQTIFANRAKKLNAEAAARNISERRRAVGDQAAEQTQLTMSCIGQISNSPMR